VSTGRRHAPADDADARQVLVDGDNLLHAARGIRDEAGLRWLLPRLRAWLPPGMTVLVMLDGHPAVGEGMRRRVAPGIDIQHSGGRSADVAIEALLASRPWGERGVTVVVSDDIALRDRVRRHGGRPRRTEWLIGRLSSRPGRCGVQPSGRSPGGPGQPAAQAGGRPAGIGRGRPPAPGGADATRGDGAVEGEAERPGWAPGRGATRKRGNPRRRRSRPAG
jgi:hypothetical protein